MIENTHELLDLLLELRKIKGLQQSIQTRLSKAEAFAQSNPPAAKNIKASIEKDQEKIEQGLAQFLPQLNSFTTPKNSGLVELLKQDWLGAATAPNQDIVNDHDIEDPLLRQLIPICHLFYQLESNGIAKEHAQKLAAIFNDVDTALNYLQHFANENKDKEQILHDACLVTLPDETYRLSTWQALAKRHYKDKRFWKVLTQASAIEKLIQEDNQTGKKPNLKQINQLKNELSNTKKAWLELKKHRNELENEEEFKQLSARLSEVKIELAEAYAGTALNDITPIDMLAAYLEKYKVNAGDVYKRFIDNGLTESDYQRFCQLELIDDAEQIPQLTLDGTVLGYEGYYIRRLNVEAPKDAALACRIGKLTDCCQSLSGEAGQPCVIHGLTSPYGGFYVLFAGDIKTADADDRLLAAAWTWRAKKTTINQVRAEASALVFDSVEISSKAKKDPHKKQCVIDMFEHFAFELVRNGHCHTVNVGTDSGISNKVGISSTTTQLPIDYKAYRDSSEQRLVFSKFHVLLFLNKNSIIDQYLKEHYSYSPEMPFTRHSAMAIWLENIIFEPSSFSRMTYNVILQRFSHRKNEIASLVTTLIKDEPRALFYVIQKKDDCLKELDFDTPEFKSFLFSVIFQGSSNKESERNNLTALRKYFEHRSEVFEATRIKVTLTHSKGEKKLLAEFLGTPKKLLTLWRKYIQCSEAEFGKKVFDIYLAKKATRAAPYLFRVESLIEVPGLETMLITEALSRTDDLRHVIRDCLVFENWLTLRKMVAHPDAKHTQHFAQCFTNYCLAQLKEQYFSDIRYLLNKEFSEQASELETLLISKTKEYEYEDGLHLLIKQCLQQKNILGLRHIAKHPEIEKAEFEHALLAVLKQLPSYEANKYYDVWETMLSHKLLNLDHLDFNTELFQGYLDYLNKDVKVAEAKQQNTKNRYSYYDNRYSMGFYSQSSSDKTGGSKDLHEITLLGTCVTSRADELQAALENYFLQSHAYLMKIVKCKYAVLKQIDFNHECFLAIMKPLFDYAPPHNRNLIALHPSLAVIFEYFSKREDELDRWVYENILVNYHGSLFRVIEADSLGLKHIDFSNVKFHRAIEERLITFHGDHILTAKKSLYRYYAHRKNELVEMLENFILSNKGMFDHLINGKLGYDILAKIDFNDPRFVDIVRGTNKSLYGYFSLILKKLSRYYSYRIGDLKLFVAKYIPNNFQTLEFVVKHNMPMLKDESFPENITSHLEPTKPKDYQKIREYFSHRQEEFDAAVVNSIDALAKTPSAYEDPSDIQFHILQIETIAKFVFYRVPGLEKMALTSPHFLCFLDTAMQQEYQKEQVIEYFNDRILELTQAFTCCKLSSPTQNFGTQWLSNELQRLVDSIYNSADNYYWREEEDITEESQTTRAMSA